MPPAADLASLSLSGVAHRCKQETERFFQRISSDTRYCFELFRRAIVDRTDLAWDLIYTQYSALVLGWVKQHAGFAACGEEAPHFANRSFEKMWSAMTPEKFTHSPDLSSLLSYWQMCVHSVITDHLRRKNRPGSDAPLPLDGPQEPPGGSGTDTIIIDEMEQQALWALIRKRLHNAREEQLLYYRFVLDLKPSEICTRFPEEFSNVNEIYLMLQNILARLRRDPELRKFLGDDD